MDNIHNPRKACVKLKIILKDIPSYKSLHMLLFFKCKLTPILAWNVPCRWNTVLVDVHIVEVRVFYIPCVVIQDAYELFLAFKAKLEYDSYICVQSHHSQFWNDILPICIQG